MPRLPFSSAFVFRLRHLRAGLGLIGGVSLTFSALAADWESLKSKSPFGQPPETPAAQAPSGELEFRGVVREDDVTLINIFNTATQKSQWIPLQGTANGIAADSYDASSDKVQVTMGGRALTLPLKRARVSLVQAPPPPPPTAPGQAPGGGENRPVVTAGGTPPAPGSPDAQQAFRNLPPEARSMIEEIRRRRALRAQQAQQPAAANAAAPQTAQPAVEAVRQN